MLLFNLPFPRKANLPLLFAGFDRFLDNDSCNQIHERDGHLNLSLTQVCSSIDRRKNTSHLLNVIAVKVRDIKRVITPKDSEPVEKVRHGPMGLQRGTAPVAHRANKFNGK